MQTSPQIRAFLSTSPARGTTDTDVLTTRGIKISIHVPREGDDGVYGGRKKRR